MYLGILGKVQRLRAWRVGAAAEGQEEKGGGWEACESKTRTYPGLASVPQPDQLQTFIPHLCLSSQGLQP